MIPKKHQTIEEQGGLKPWIDNGFAAGKWQYDHDHFILFRHELRLSKAKIRELFGKDKEHPLAPQTLNHWYIIDDKERDHGQN